MASQLDWQEELAAQLKQHPDSLLYICINEGDEVNEQQMLIKEVRFDSNEELIIVAVEPDDEE